MKIGVIVPRPVPYQRGGAENLVDGFVKYGREFAHDDIDIIAVDSLEDSFWDIIQTYNRFFHLDVSKYDMVISMKYPAWMVYHPRHVCYMLHTLRGLYDTYSFFNLDLVVLNFPKQLEAIFAIIRGDIFSRDLFKEVYNLLIQNRDFIDEIDFSVFPGPFLREIVHFFDKCGQQNVSEMYCLSKTVRDRDDYFLPKLEPIEVVYPAPLHDNFEFGEFDYFFTVSRLDSSKRIDLIIKAFKQSKTSRKLLIAGKGPCEAELKYLAGDDPRIIFLGFVDDEKLISLYANCLAVIFVPYDEDYGYITIEAMKSKKMVITFGDSGGVLEFVENNKTGFVCTFRDLSKRIDYVSDNPKMAKMMGEAAYGIVKDISWKHVYEKLVKPIPKRKNILILNTYSIYPTIGGGQVREYNLYKRLSDRFNIKYLSVVPIDKCSSETALGRDFSEILITESTQQADERFSLERRTGESLFDVMNIYNIQKNPQFVEKFIDLQGWADIIVFSHPFMINLYELIEKRSAKKIIFASHNVEYKLKQDVYKNIKIKTDILSDIFEAEKASFAKADHILTVSDEDKNDYMRVFDMPTKDVTVISNGVDTRVCQYVTQSEYTRVRRLIGVPDGRKVCTFLGSWHRPNLDAFKFILSLAEKRKDCLFFIIGSVYNYYLSDGGLNENIPANVKCFGIVDDIIKLELLRVSDVALNPVVGGSGSNLKIFEYMSMGIPVITTKFGARGMVVTNGREVIFADSHEDFLFCIDKISLNFEDRRIICEKAREYIEKNFDWNRIADQYADILG